MAMRLPGIGVDILHLPRVQALIERRSADALAKRLLSKTEHDEFCKKFSERVRSAKGDGFSELSLPSSSEGAQSLGREVEDVVRYLGVR